jgi:hypothetical protein
MPRVRLCFFGVAYSLIVVMGLDILSIRSNVSLACSCCSKLLTAISVSFCKPIMLYVLSTRLGATLTIHAIKHGGVLHQ